MDWSALVWAGLGTASLGAGAHRAHVDVNTFGGITASTSTTCVYTDGSHALGCSSWAWFCPTSGLWQAGTLTGKLSSTLVEIAAVGEAVQAFTGHVSDLLVVTDCASVAFLAHSPKLPRDSVRTGIAHLHARMRAAQCAGTRVRVAWTRGHAHSHGNRVADRLAAWARRCPGAPLSEGQRIVDQVVSSLNCPGEQQVLSPVAA